MISVMDVRKSMRISHNALDTDIDRNVEAARLDMSRVGIDTESKDDALIDKAIELYCKAQFNYQGKGEQFLKNYEKLRDSMSLAGEYRCETK